MLQREFYEGYTPHFNFPVIMTEEIDSTGVAAEFMHRIRHEAAKALFAPLSEWGLDPIRYSDSYHFRFDHMPLGFRLERNGDAIRLTHSMEVITFNPDLGIMGGLDHKALAERIPALWEELKDAVLAEERDRRIVERIETLADITKKIEQYRRRFNNPPVRKPSLWGRIKAAFK